MERLRELTQENKRLTNENQEYKKTIERLGSALAQSGSTGVAQQDHGTAGETTSVCSADRVVGLFCGQAGAGPLAGDGHVAPSASLDV
jgi:hypothetical protein